MWTDLFAAIALVMVIEGLLPFFSPRGFRKNMETISQLPDNVIRYIGLFSMIAGVVLLYFVRQT